MYILDKWENSQSIPPLIEEIQANYKKHSTQKLPLIEAAIQNAWALRYIRAGALDSFLVFAERTEAILKSENQPDHPIMANIYGHLGEYYVLTGNDEEAQRYYEKAINLTKKVFGSTHFQLGSYYRNLGKIYVRKFRPETIDYFEKSLDNYLLNFGEAHPKVVSICNDFALYYANANGPQFDKNKAQAYFDKGMRAARKIGFNYKSGYDLYIALAAYNLEVEQDTAQVTAHLNKAYDILKALHPDPYSEHFGTYYAFRMIYNYLFNNFAEGDKYFYETVKTIQYDIKKPLKKFNNITDKSKLNYLLSTRLKFYDQAYLNLGGQSLLDSVSAQCAYILSFIDDAHRKGSLSGEMTLHGYTYYVYEPAIRAILADSTRANEEAFTLIEKVKSRSLLNNIQKNKTENFLGVPKDWIENDNALVKGITSLEKSLFEEKNQLGVPNESKVSQIQDSLFELKEKRQAIVRQIKAEFPKFYDFRYEASSLQVSEVQEFLESDEALIEYFIEEKTIFIFVVKKDSFWIKSVPKDFPLKGLIQQVRENLYSYWNSDHQTDSLQYRNNALYADAAHQLYQKLIGPIAEGLPSKLLIIPDNILHFLPFDALLVEPSGDSTDFANHHYLIQDHVIKLDYSAKVYQRRARQKIQATQGFMATFAPSFIRPTGVLASQSRSVNEIRSSLNPLVYNELEAKQLAEITKATIFSGNMASKETFLKQASNFNILHLATHGKANDQLGKFSYIAFTESGDTTQNEGKLYVGELYNLKLNAEMVVLSACETGLGQIHRGEGPISISQGFAYAGAQSTITTLWSILDHPSTVSFMECFYKKLQKGLPKDIALWETKLEALKDPETSSPYFWAGFVAIGNMSPISFPGPFSNWMYLIGMVGLIGLVIALFYLKRYLVMYTYFSTAANWSRGN